MISPKRNNTLDITLEEFGTLELIDSGALGNFRSLMDEEEALEVESSGRLWGVIMPFAYSFAPSLESAQNLLKELKSSIKKEIKLNLALNGEIIGDIDIKSFYEQKNPGLSIFTAKNICILNKGGEQSGKIAISGEFSLRKNQLVSTKEQIQKRIAEVGANKVTAIMLTADPMHRLHERLIRMTIDKADLVLIFLVRTFSSEGRLDFDLRLECLEYVCENYIPKERVCIVPFSNTTLFSDHINPVLEAIAAKNFGANKLVIGQSHTGLGLHYDHNIASTLLDDYASELGLELIVMPEMFYCELCHTIVSSKSCPHGAHHHIKYHVNTLKKLLFKGIMPPAMLMRPQVSAIILDRLYPKRFNSLQKLCGDLFPNDGIVESYSQRDFYEKLMRLYQTSSLGS
ncbi:sulfate adenylyltransferase [Campylobacter sp.]|uniref:sulfate adenylyltransferase n=1 Tax=Campylobacter sp. TaxID=205 RepID=UPI002A75F902|nr:sulfate adenylyltransferase [Campylobacter sp.]MDY3245646.1 sulfate adenylyltransferase [Campylobacter sp.]